MRDRNYGDVTPIVKLVDSSIVFPASIARPTVPDFGGHERIAAKISRVQSSAVGYHAAFGAQEFGDMIELRITGDCWLRSERPSQFIYVLVIPGRLAAMKNEG